MHFVNARLSELMQVELTDEEAVAQRTNLCLEERITSERQATYEASVAQPTDWADWREAHKRYVQEDVRRTRPLSAAFSGGDSLRPHLEGNQELYRVERIDSVLRKYAAVDGRPVDVDRVREWMSSRDSHHEADPDAPAPAEANLEGLTETLNEDRSDGRPRFVAFAAEFPGLEEQPDWPKTFCERCGLAHHFVGTPVTLALFRYSVEEVMTTCREAGTAAVVFAVPTVLDQEMWNVYFSAPASLEVGHAVGLAPRPDCSHLAAELIHAKMAYKAEHWVAVSTLTGDSASSEKVSQLRASHLDCLRRTHGNSSYGAHCVD